MPSTVEFFKYPDGYPGNGWDRADGYGMQNLANEGSVFWFRGFLNRVTNNVACNASSYGYTYFAEYIGEGPGAGGFVDVPTTQGQTLTAPVNMNATPIAEFVGNECYGAVPAGLTIWWLGCQANTPLTCGESVLAGLKAWHTHGEAIFLYQTNHLTVDGLTARNEGYYSGIGVTPGDYFSKDLRLVNSDIQGFLVGFTPGSNGPASNPQVVQNCTLRNYWNVVTPSMATSNYSTDWIPPRRTVLDGVTMLRPGIPDFGDKGPQWDILRSQQPIWIVDTTNLMVLDELIVTNYNGVGDSFKVYYLESAPGAIPPTSTLNSDGTHRLFGQDAPGGLTNAQLLSAGKPVAAGAVSPTTNQRVLIRGYVG